MSNKTFEKKKQRERESKKKVLARRTAIRAEAKKEREEGRESILRQRVTNRLEGRTIRYTDNKEQEDAVVMNQLEHNLSILEALQKEHQAEKEAMLNAPQMSLEGVPGVPDNTVGGLGASADVVFIPNPEPAKDEV